MRLVTEALHAALIADPTLVGLLAQYAGEVPAIFTADPIPEDAEPPYVCIAGVVGDVPGEGETKGSRGRDITQDILVVAEESGDPAAVDTIADRVRELLHRVSLPVAGYGTILTQVQGPVAVPSDERLYGRLLTVRVVLTS